MKEFLRNLVYKIQSRKFTVEIIATVAYFLGKMTAKEWIIVSAIYIGGNVFKGLVDVLKGKIGGE